MAKVDQDLCISCGICAQLCPEGFEMAANGKATAIPGAAADCIQDAVDQCPVGAISA